MNITDIVYIEQLKVRDSYEFKTLASELQTTVADLFLVVPGRQRVNVVFFQ